ncbi:MAG TPA: hypothetical protein VE130_05740 [Nitrososphaeraceae archaeon]|nr:hypothetical protein [Nitrososphaeraceae archaeon]
MANRLLHFLDNLGPNLFINSRAPSIASGNKIAAIALVVAGLTICNNLWISLFISKVSNVKPIFLV